MDIVNRVKALKSQLDQEGFKIDGIVGSYAHGDYTDESDIDILYHIDEHFVQNYHGFTAFTRIAEIKRFLAEQLQKEVDLIALRGLSETAKKHMLSKVIDV